MVKSVLGVNHQGLRDWVIQRKTAMIMAVYTVGLVAFFIGHSPLTYGAWHDLFAHTWMKVASILFLVSLLYHAWIGMWTVFTDYVKPIVLRATLSFIVQLMLVACFVWGLIVLWSV